MLFPYAAERLAQHLEATYESEQTAADIDLLRTLVRCISCTQLAARRLVAHASTAGVALPLVRLLQGPVQLSGCSVFLDAQRKSHLDGCI